MKYKSGDKPQSFGRVKVWGAFLVLAVLVTACLPAGLRLPESPLLRSLERKSGLIVYVGSDGNIYTIDQGGGNQQALTTDAQGASGEGDVRHIYQFPAWSPDGRRLAFVGYHFQENELTEVSLYVTSTDRGKIVEAFRSDEYYPFYLYWSPNGEKVSFLASSASGGAMTLQLIPANGGEAEILGSGSPLYWAWSPDNLSILTHFGSPPGSSMRSRLAVLDLEGELQEMQLGLQPGFFQSPDWSSSGDELLLAGKTEANGEEGLLLMDPQGQIKQVLATIEGPVAFGWSPDGKWLAYITGEISSAAESARKLVILDSDRPEETQKVFEEIVIAFFWSPDSRKLAYFEPALVDPSAETESGTSEPLLGLKLHVLDVRSGESQQVAVFQPTDNFFNILPYFDQYQHSTTIWSPDSRYLVIGAVSGEGEAGIYVVESSANLQPRFITAGEVGFWSWK